MKNQLNGQQNCFQVSAKCADFDLSHASSGYKTNLLANALKVSQEAFDI